MFNLSKKAAGRYRLKWSDIEEKRGDRWKIDVIMVSRYPVIWIIHEYTLFTLVRNKKDFRTIQDIADEIIRCCSWYNYTGILDIGKNTDKKLNGNINEMKRITADHYSSSYLAEIQNRINTGIYSKLSTGKYSHVMPSEAVALYKKGEWPLKSEEI